MRTNEMLLRLNDCVRQRGYITKPVLARTSQGTYEIVDIAWDEDEGAYLLRMAERVQ